MDTECIEYTTCEKQVQKFILVDGQYAGCILITDEVKPDSKKAISDLKHIGVEKTVMLTGDDEKLGSLLQKNCSWINIMHRPLPDQKWKRLSF